MSASSCIFNEFPDYIYGINTCRLYLLSRKASVAVEPEPRQIVMQPRSINSVTANITAQRAR